MDIGQKIKQRRLELNLTQKEVAKAAGITEATLSRYENNQRIPPADILIKLANVLKVNVDYFVPASLQAETAKLLGENKNDIDRAVREMIENLDSSYQSLTLSGQPLNEKTKEYLKESLEIILKYAKVINNCR